MGWVEGNWPYDELKLELKRRSLAGDGPPVRTSSIWGKLLDPQGFLAALEKTGCRLVAQSEGLSISSQGRAYMWHTGVMKVGCQGVDNVNLDIELITPIAMGKGLRFAIREGGKTVGAGLITEIKE